MSSLPQQFLERFGKSVFIFVALTMFACMMFTVRGMTQQDQERLLERRIHPKEPLRIKAIRGKKGDVMVNKKFLDGDDWLRALTFRLENISDKNIVFARIELEFPRSDDSLRSSSLFSTGPGFCRTTLLWPGTCSSRLVSRGSRRMDQSWPPQNPGGHDFCRQ